MNQILLYTGSAIIILWGVAHLVPTKVIVRGFGETSEDNRRIITMEWIAEGLALCFIGLLVLLTTALSDPSGCSAQLVYYLSAGMLVIMAGLSLMTGARTSIIPIKVCPAVKIIVAILFMLGSVL
jgi:hypothetical protein